MSNRIHGKPANEFEVFEGRCYWLLHSLVITSGHKTLFCKKHYSNIFNKDYLEQNVSLLELLRQTQNQNFVS